MKTLINKMTGFLNLIMIIKLEYKKMKNNFMTKMILKINICRNILKIYAKTFKIFQISICKLIFYFRKLKAKLDLDLFMIEKYYILL